MRVATFEEVKSLHQGMCWPPIDENSCAACIVRAHRGDDVAELEVPEGLTKHEDGSVTDATGKQWVSPRI